MSNSKVRVSIKKQNDFFYIKKLVETCKKNHTLSKMGIFLGIALKGKVIIYCSEPDAKSFLKSTILNKNMPKVILDNQAVSNMLKIYSRTA
jgi:hypothetical protein